MQMHEPARLIHFDRLKERLLIAGIAPRHVRRTLAELRDHYDDAVRAERQKGTVSAEQLAWARLGHEDDIAAAVIARPELRSLPARFPKLFFGAGPITLWAAAIVFTILAIALLIGMLRTAGLMPPLGTPPPQWSHAPLLAVCFFYERLLPLIIGGTVMVTAARQRLTSHWPIIGVALVALMGGMTSISLIFPNELGDHGRLNMSNVLVSPLVGDLEKQLTVSTGISISVLNFLIILAPYALWRARIRRKPTLF